MKRTGAAAILLGLALVRPAIAQTDDFTLAVTPSTSTRGTWWAQGDYLLWRIKEAPLVGPLITTGSPADPLPGALNQPGTRILVGGNQDYGTFNGLRLAAGHRPGDDGLLGFEFGGFMLEQRRVSASFASDPNGIPVLAQPVLSPLLTENTFLSAMPAIFTGDLGMTSSTQLHGWETMLSLPVGNDSSLRFEALGGFRSLRLAEDLQVFSDTTAIPPSMIVFLGAGVPAGTTISVRDTFRTTNDFYGGQVGGRMTFMAEAFGVELLGKVAAGVNQQVLTIQGATGASMPGVAPVAVPGGVLALSSNMGRHYRSVFAVIPEAGANAVWAVTPNVRLRLGYSFLYISQVIRPGNQYDRVLDPARIPSDAAFGAATVARPAVHFRENEFWAQGVNFGVEFRY